MSLANSTLNIKDLPKVCFNVPDEKEFAITLQTLDQNQSDDSDKPYEFEDGDSDKFEQ